MSDLLQEPTAASDALDSPADDRAVAIVGMSCRFPGAPGIEAYWENLRSGVESVRTFSDEELLAAGVDPAALDDPRLVRAAAVVDGTDLFDPVCFGMNLREAEIMDPQHRLFLECAWEALERAGCDPDSCGGLIGVYAGAGANTYAWNNLRPNRELLAALGEFRVMVGNDKDFLATQAAYRLNLRGPSIAVQTACSTSLVAVHLACLGLLNYDCDVALAGGVNLLVPQTAGYRYDEGGILSPDGRCRAFAAAAAGTALGEGAGVVVLKRLRDALADGDPVHAVILGSAVNNDGARKVGFTAPGEDGQADVIATAQGVAGVDPESVTYVEAHGTGTALGDPIEVAALTQAFRARTAARGFCALGSVKTNIGHLDAAAGVAGLIKAALALEHRTIPPSLHCAEPNPKIDFAASPFYLPTQAVAWQPAGPRRAGVSSFGIGGTNAHAILEEAPPAAASGPARPRHLLALSARTPAALAAAAARLADHLERQPGIELADAAYTLACGRRGLEQRGFVVCRDRGEAVAGLRAAALAGRGGERARGRNRPVFFLFPGQGAQHAGMARGLYDEEPGFRETFDECSRLLRPHLGMGLDELLFAAPGEEDLLIRTQYAQPALFAVEYALARLWMEWGIVPEGMLGHSIGEYVAACLAGVMTLPAALELVACRGRLMEALPAGAMLSVAAGAGEVGPLLGAGLSLAAVNSPVRTVVSGTPEAVAELARAAAARGFECRPLLISHAFHSAMMEPVLSDFGAAVTRAGLAPPERPYVSNLTGTWITPGQATDPAYWTAHLRQTVQCSAGLETLLAVPGAILLEVGPGRTLTTFAGQHPAGEGGRTLVASLPHPHEGAEDGASLHRALGQLWAAGAAVSWRGYFGRERRRTAVLPTYPFERRRCWIEPPPERPGVLGALTTALPAGAGTPPALAPGGRYLVTDGSAPAGRAFAEAAAARGAAVVPAGDSESLEALVARLAAEPAGLQGIVHPLRLPPGSGLAGLSAELDRLGGLGRALGGFPGPVLVCAPPPVTGADRLLAESLSLAAVASVAPETPEAPATAWHFLAPAGPWAAAAFDRCFADPAHGVHGPDGEAALPTAAEPAGLASLADLAELARLAEIAEIERSIIEIWREQLGGIEPDRETSFFELGGDSLVAIRAFTRLSEVHGVTLPLAAMFEAPTIPGLAARIHQLRAAAALAPVGGDALAALIDEIGDLTAEEVEALLAAEKSEAAGRAGRPE